MPISIQYTRILTLHCIVVKLSVDKKKHPLLFHDTASNSLKSLEITFPLSIFGFTLHGTQEICFNKVVKFIIQSSQLYSIQLE